MATAEVYDHECPEGHVIRLASCQPFIPCPWCMRDKAQKLEQERDEAIELLMAVAHERGRTLLDGLRWMRDQGIPDARADERRAVLAELGEDAKRRFYQAHPSESWLNAASSTRLLYRGLALTATIGPTGPEMG